MYPEKMIYDNQNLNNFINFNNYSITKNHIYKTCMLLLLIHSNIIVCLN